MRRSIPAVMAILALSLPACSSDDEPEAGSEPAATERGEAAAAGGRGSPVIVYGDGDASLSREEIERGRHDPSWRRYTRMGESGDPSSGPDSDATPGATNGETWDDITARSVRARDVSLPLHGEAEGPSVVAAQILLDRALFSPGVIDGYWGKNIEKAVYWFEERHGLQADGRLDPETFRLLREAAGPSTSLIRRHRLTGEEVSGPFVDIPAERQAQAELECMCWESRREKLAETFHVTPELLERLNPGVDLESASEGDELAVPAVETDRRARGDSVARLVISGGGSYLHALDARGRILYHFPATLGSEYASSPSGDYAVESIHPDPMWHYQPDLLTGVPDDEEDAMIPAGPNNPVGVVWMQLTKPHYGIHGTSAPETIGYATSHGCVRLTNWDADFLRRQIEAGVAVEFRDTERSGP